MEMNQPIGVLDSGSGGLSVWQSMRALMPNESTVYIGDHRHLPYGEMGADQPGDITRLFKIASFPSLMFSSAVNRK